MFLKQSTALYVNLGPYVDDTDGKTAETALSLTVYVSKNGAAAAARSSTTSITHDRDGYYRVHLNTTDTGTLGLLRIWASPSGALPVWRDFTILPSAVYDALIDGASNLPVNVAAISADSTAADNLEAMLDGTGGVTLSAVLGTDAITNSSLAASAANEIADAVWDEAISAHVILGSTAEALAAAGSAGDPWSTLLPGSYGTGTAGKIIGERLDIAVSSVTNSPGSGAKTFVYTLTNSIDNQPIPSANVWATSDSAGTTVLASGLTNGAGQVTFYLNAGTVYIWRAKSGWNFTNPDTETVS